MNDHSNNNQLQQAMSKLYALVSSNMFRAFRLAKHKQHLTNKNRNVNGFVSSQQMQLSVESQQYMVIVVISIAQHDN